jgi:hypothetical protein
MVRFGLIAAAAVALTACEGMQAPGSGTVATSGPAYDCVIMGYRVGTARHDYCVQVMGRRLTPEEYN